MKRQKHEKTSHTLRGKQLLFEQGPDVNSSKGTIVGRGDRPVAEDKLTLLGDVSD